MAIVTKRSNQIIAAFVLSLIAGILVILEGLTRLGQGRTLAQTGVTDNVTGKILAGVGIYNLGGVALLFGALILVGAIIMYKTPMMLASSLVVLVFSILSIATGGLFGLLGFIIGIIASILALTNK